MNIGRLANGNLIARYGEDGIYRVGPCSCCICWPNPIVEDDWTNVFFGSVGDDMWSRGQLNYWYLNPFRFQLTASIGPFEVDLSVESKKSDCLYYPVSMLSGASTDIVQKFNEDETFFVNAGLFVIAPPTKYIVDYIDEDNQLIEDAPFFGAANLGLQTNNSFGLFRFQGYLNDQVQGIQHYFIYTFPNIVVRPPFFNQQPYVKMIEDPVHHLTKQVVINSETTYDYNLQLVKLVGSNTEPRYDKNNWFYDGTYPTINSTELTFL